jgi:alpha-glucosidase
MGKHVPVSDSQTALIHPASQADAEWWRSAVIYQIYPRSWADSDGDGIGDLPGVTARLSHLRSLGVDAVWFSPFFRSPQADAGYDVADYRDIDPLFGTLADFDKLLAEAHQYGLRVIVDLVPNHTSDEHAWFQAALRAEAGSAERERYIFRDGTGPDGSEPPNDWLSVFGGTAWTRVEDGQWYLHLFDAKQPDLNWENPEVRAEFEDVLRFWLDRGVDGFRVDVAHGLVKDPALPSFPNAHELLHQPEEGKRPPMWDQEGVHEIYRGWRKILDGYGEPARIMCAEAWVRPAERLVRYVRSDEFHQAFNFTYLETGWFADDQREVIESSLRASDSVGAPSTWVLSNHDVVRHASRLGLALQGKRPNGISADDPQPDHALGLRRARAATTLMLGLPGSAYIFQGEELGLPESTDMPHEYRQDPTFQRTGGNEIGRDGCRVPIPWEKDAPALGFSPTGRTWLPQPSSYAEYAVDQQAGVDGSTLELYRQLLAVRRERALGHGGLRFADGYGEDVVALENTGPESGSGSTLVLANLGTTAVPLPEGATVLVASGELGQDGSVPADTAVWAAI